MKLTQNWFLKILCAIVSGILLSLGFPGYHFPTLAVPYVVAIALVPLFYILFNLQGKHSVRTAILYTWIFGFTFQLGAFFWISQPIVYFTALSDFVGYSVYIFASTLTSLYFLILFSPLILNVWLKNKYPNQDHHQSQNQNQNKNKNIPIVLLALFMTALEIIIPRFFNWSIGQTFNNIYVWQLASIFGFNTGTFFILLTNLTFAYALTQYRNIVLFKKIFALNSIIWAGIFIFGFLRIHILQKEIAKAEKIRVAYIQPNFTFQELASKRIHATNAHEISLNTVLQMSAEVVANSLAYDNKRPDLIVWPESVAPDGIFVKSFLQNIVSSYSATWKAPILLQDTIRKYKQPTDTKLSVWSLSKIISADGMSADSFEKWVPIPFGEELPLERIFPKLGEFYRTIFSNSSKVEVGTSYKALNVQGKFNVAPLICFDSIYQRLPYLQAKHGGADLFVNQANFMWMVNSNAGLEFTYLDKARAIENVRSMVVVTNTGPTIAFDPLGRTIYGPTKLMTSSSGFIDVPLYKGKTLFSYVYNWPILILALLGVYKLILRLRSKSS